MTISSNYVPDVYAGDGSTTSFAITFEFLSDSNIVKVSLKDDTTGDITEQTSGVTITGSNAVFDTAPASGKTVLIELDPEYKQESDYRENAALPAETLEDSLDRLTLQSQLNKEKRDRALTIDSSVDISNFDTTISAITADRFIKINSTGVGFELAEDTSLIGQLSKADGTFYVGDGNEIVAESGNTARTSLGLGTGNSPTFNAVTVGAATINGNITVTGTVDGRNVSSDGTKLDGIEAGADVTLTAIDGSAITPSTVNGRDIASDGTKLDTVETNADVTDEANVTDALDGATLTAATVATDDKVLIQDTDDADVLKTVTAQSIADLGGGGGRTAITSAVTYTIDSSGADYTSINAALDDLVENNFKAYRDSGFQVILELQTGFVLEEQILVDGIDLSWIQIDSVDATVTADDSAMTDTTSGGFPYFLLVTNGGVSPVLNFVGSFSPSSSTHSALAAEFLGTILAKDAGFINGHRGINLLFTGGRYIGSGDLNVSNNTRGANLLQGYLETATLTADNCTQFGLNCGIQSEVRIRGNGSIGASMKNCGTALDLKRASRLTCHREIDCSSSTTAGLVCSHSSIWCDDTLRLSDPSGLHFDIEYSDIVVNNINTSGSETGTNVLYQSRIINNSRSSTLLDVADSSIIQAEIGSEMHLSGKVFLDADPTANLGAATKQYVDNAIPSLAANMVQTTNSTEIDTTSETFVSTGISANITPSASNSKVRISFTGYGRTNNDNRVHYTIFRDSTNVAGAGNEILYKFSTDDDRVYSMDFLDSPSTTSQVTYSIHWRVTDPSGTTQRAYLNENGWGVTTLTVEEVKQ